MKKKESKSTKQDTNYITIYNQIEREREREREDIR